MREGKIIQREDERGWSYSERREGRIAQGERAGLLRERGYDCSEEDSTGNGMRC